MWARRSQVFESIRYLGRVAYIEMIKEPFSKTRAKIDFLSNIANTSELAKIWCLLFMKNHLVRVTTRKCKFEK